MGIWSYTFSMIKSLIGLTSSHFMLSVLALDIPIHN